MLKGVTLQIYASSLVLCLQELIIKEFSWHWSNPSCCIISLFTFELNSLLVLS